MNSSPGFIDYKETGYFSKMVTDYIASADALTPFYQHPVSVQGIKSAIEARKHFSTDRKLLVAVMEQQYKNVTLTAIQRSNIQQLGNTGTFTICTAHQPNIFTGHLYFIYKIIHTIRLADTLQQQLPQYKFVPVYYMGSEDADLEELGHIFINGEKYEWKTNQVGAVGRMKVDKALLKLLELAEGQLLIYPYGKEIIELMRSCYKEGNTIEQATFQLVNALFAEYGLLVLLPDNPVVKKVFIPVVEKELKEHFSHEAVEATVNAFPKEYKVQASGRELNLFYLKDDSRERITGGSGEWSTINSKLRFNEEELLVELRTYPERFSPNVILRPVFQEMILPNIAFIGGGGEIAYWLELRKVFESVGVPFPMLVIRNSFMLIRKEVSSLIEKLQFSEAGLFKEEKDLLNELVKRDSSLQLSLENQRKSLCNIYKEIKTIVGPIDTTLQQHVQSLHLQVVKKIEALEKKMLKAEKKKFESQQRQLTKIKSLLFPNNSLQERIDNLMPWYAKYGKDFIRSIYEHSLSLEQKFTILKEE